MNRFLRSRPCRCCVCLILVLVFLISWSPIRVQASVLGGAALLFGDDAIAILLAVLAGLGVCAVAGSEASDLETRAIARNAMDAMEEAGTYVRDGALTVYNSATAAWSYAVSTDLVQWLHDWLWTEKVISPGVITSSVSTYTNAFGEEYTTAAGSYFVMKFNFIDVDNHSYHRYYQVAISTRAFKNSAGTTINKDVTFGSERYYYTRCDQSGELSDIKEELATGSLYLGFINRGDATKNLEYAICLMLARYFDGNG